MKSDMRQEIKSALLLRLGGLGDLLVTLPSITLVRKRLQSWKLSLVCREDYGVLFRETGIVDEVLSESSARLAPLFAEAPDLCSERVHWLKNFSLILGWMKKQENLSLKKKFDSQGENRCCFLAYDSKEGKPVSKSFFIQTWQFLGHSNSQAFSFDECAFLPLSLKHKKEGLKLFSDEIRRRGEKIVVIHPGSGSKSKCWPLENFLEIICFLSSRGVKGALVTGEAEEWMADEMEKASLPKGWQWIPNPPLIKLAGLLGEASLYLGNDSGVTHLAAACGTRVLALFRRDLEPSWRPYGRAFVMSAFSPSEISVNLVRERILDLLSLC